MTLRQIYAALEGINIENHNKVAMQAAFKGKKMQFKEFRQEYEDLSEENEKLMKAAIKEATQRKVLEMAKKNQGKNR